MRPAGGISYWDEDLGMWVPGEPHYDEYFEEDEPPAMSADLLLAMESLDDKQRFVLELRYGLRKGALGHEFTQAEIADMMGITQQAVSQLEDSACKQLERLVNSGISTG